jgi:orotidine-5'-phosphate decarboxylase
MAAYARAYLAPSAPLEVDAITASPYLGAGSLDPAFTLAGEHDKGVFVLALTSNPEGAQVQHAVGADGRSVAQTVLRQVAERNTGRTPLGDIGVVVGATIGEAPIDLDGLNGPFLVPGIGAQGATADDVRRIFAAALSAVVPSVSREILGYGPDIAALQNAVTAQAARFAFLRA